MSFRHSRLVRPLSVTLIIAAGLAGTACSTSAEESLSTDLLATPLPTPQSADAKSTAGRLIRATPVTAGSAGRGQVAVFSSTDGATGSPTRVSAAFFVPSGKAPTGGWPVIAIGHGTTGLTPDCGPTKTPSTLTDIGPVTMLLQRGYAVTLVDYQGLGIATVGTAASDTNPRHPYLEPRSAAYNLADSVRALRAAHPGVISTRWGAAGHSQGGQAAWSAAEFAPDYAPELTLVAASAQAPAVNLRRLGRISHGAYTSREEWLMPMVITGLSVSAPTIKQSDFLRGSVKSNLPLLISCNPADDEKRQKATDAISSDDVTPSTDAAAQALTSVLQSYSLPQRVTKVPMYVTQGTDDPVVAASSTTIAVRQACQLGSSVSYHQLKGRDHDIGDDMSGYEWLLKTMSGTAAHSNCSLRSPAG